MTRAELDRDYQWGYRFAGQSLAIRLADRLAGLLMRSAIRIDRWTMRRLSAIDR